jgi:hypothetical protein
MQDQGLNRVRGTPAPFQLSVLWQRWQSSPNSPRCLSSARWQSTQADAILALATGLLWHW